MGNGQQGAIPIRPTTTPNAVQTSGKADEGILSKLGHETAFLSEGSIRNHTKCTTCTLYWNER